MERIAPAHVDSAFHFGFQAPTRRRTRCCGWSASPRLWQYAGAEQRHRDALAGRPHRAAGVNGRRQVDADQAARRRGRAAERRAGPGARPERRLLRPAPARAAAARVVAPAAPAGRAPHGARAGAAGFPRRLRLRRRPGARARRTVLRGEKARLVLAQIVYRRPNLLLPGRADQPPRPRDALGAQRRAAGLRGGRWCSSRTTAPCCVRPPTRSGWCTRPRGRVSRGTRRLSALGGGAARGAGRATAAGAAGEHTAAARKDRRRTEAEERKRLQPLRQRVEQWEHAIARLGAEHAAIEQRLADPALYQDDQKETLKAILADKARLVAAVSQAEAAGSRPRRRWNRRPRSRSGAPPRSIGPRRAAYR